MGSNQLIAKAGLLTGSQRSASTRPPLIDRTFRLNDLGLVLHRPIETTGLRGGQRRYSNLAVRTALTLRVVFGLPLRQTEGFLDSLLRLMSPRPQGPGPHHPLAPEPNRCGAAPEPSPTTARST